MYAIRSYYGGSCVVQGGRVTCNLGSMALGDTAMITIQATISGAGTILNTTTISGSRQDLNPGNNTVVTSTLVGNPVAPLLLSYNFV